MRLAPFLTAVILCASVAGAQPTADAPHPAGPLYHVVAIKFKPGTSPQQIKNVEEAFADLKTKIPLIQSLHWGTNVSKENRNKGFTHGFVLTFNNEKDRDAYLKDPAHKSFGQLLGPVAADIFVIDFQARG